MKALKIKFHQKGLAILIASICCISVFAQETKTASILYHQGLHLEEVKGELEQATAVYQQVLEQYTKERELSAKAQLHIGICYEKLGKNEAQKAYRRVIQDFADQTLVVADARERLAALEQPGTTASSTSELVVRRVWAGPEVDVLGTLSPDGRYLSYVDWETGDLAVHDVKTGKKRHLTNKGSWAESREYALYSTMSPDGRQVAYTWFNQDGGPELRIIGLDGSMPRILYRNEELNYLDPTEWSPDGKHILVIFARKDRTNQIVLVSVVDGSVQVLKTLDWRSPQKMSFSPDGRYIVYDFQVKEATRERDIFLLAADGSREMPLVEHPADEFVLGWLPDGKRILFASDRTGTLGAWVIQVADGKPQGSPKLVKPDMPNVGWVQPMGFTPKGSFYYLLHTKILDVYTATLDPDTGKVLIPPTVASQRFVGANSGPDWSPDGQYLAYRRDGPLGKSRPRIIIRSDKTGEERELSTELHSMHIRGPRWSPDGSSFLVIGADAKNRWGLYQIDVQTGTVTPLVLNEPGGYISKREWAPDGKAILFIRSNHIVVRDLETGREEELQYLNQPVYGSALALSSDGRWLAFTSKDSAMQSVALNVMPMAGGEPHELLRVQEPEVSYALAWTPDGRHLLFTKERDPYLTSPSNQKTELWQISAEGGAPQKLGLAMNGLTHLRVHPDGRRIAFTAGQYKSEVWVMENFLPELKAAR